MFKRISLITFQPGATQSDRLDLRAALEALSTGDPEVARARLSDTGAYVVNGGDLHWHVQFRSEAEYMSWSRGPGGHRASQLLAAHPVIHADSVAYQQGSTAITQPELRDGIHRTLLLALRPSVSAQLVAAFEAEMRQMADYVPAIRNWSLSRVVHASGSRGWTHVWEQDFQGEADLNGPYMMHPIHFGSIDRWFDSQSHDWIIDTQLCHSYCFTSESMIAPLPA